jgi:K+-sensing histidine kinase KdpD
MQKMNALRVELDSGRTLRHENIEMILNILKKINHSLILSDVLNLVMMNAIKIAKAERGFLLLLDNNNELKYRIGLDLEGELVPESAFKISRSVVNDSFKYGESICIENALGDDSFHSRRSILNLELQTVLCTPLIANNEKIGVIYVDSKKLQAINKDEVVKIFEILAGHAAIAIRNAKLYEELNDAFNEVQSLHERLIKSERIVLKKELNTEIGHEVQSLVHLALLENDSILRKIQKIPAGSPVHPDDLQELVQKIYVATESVRKIQRFSQTLISSTRLESKKELRDLNITIRSVVQYLKQMNKFRKVNFILNLEKVPLIEYDAEQIEQVLVNLLNNSVEKREDTTVKLSTLNDEEYDQIVVKVNDNGPGISHELTKDVFAPKVHKKLNGRGYGLIMAKKIIDLKLRI